MPLAFLGTLRRRDRLHLQRRRTTRFTGGREVGGPDQVWELTVRRTSRSASSRWRVALAARAAGRASSSATTARARSSRSPSATPARAIPELALIALVVAFVGVGLLNVTIALMVLGHPADPHQHLRRHPPGRPRRGRGRARDGHERPRRSSRRVELPLAVPTIMSGVRTAAINIIATATIAPLAGVLTLGDLILSPQRLRRRGRARGRDPRRPARAHVELGLAGLQRLLTPKGLKLARETRSRIGFASMTPRQMGLPNERRVTC